MSQIFREYIGYGPDSLKDFPADIINSKISEFHFVLAFASELYVDRKGTGQFQPKWNEVYFGPEHVRKVKRDHPNVKVIISIGGRDPQHQFNPIEKEEWIKNAVSSINDIVNSYDELIDGIGIFYDYIRSTPQVFTDYIGDLLQKERPPFSVLSIAPSPAVLSHYTLLYNTHKDIIDFVDYQFYREKLHTKPAFENRFFQLYDTFGLKLVAGFSTDPNDKSNLPLDVFIEGCKDLVGSGSLQGIFVWDANYSAQDGPTFPAERKLQEILTAEGSLSGCQHQI